MGRRQERLLLTSLALVVVAALPAPPALAVNLQFERELAKAETGTSFVARATLDAISASDTCIALVSSNPALLAVPPSVVVPAGTIGAEFRVQLARTVLTAPTDVAIRGTVVPCVASSTVRALTVLPAPSVVSVQPAASAVQGGGNLTLQLGLSRPAAFPGVAVTFANNGNGLLSHAKSVTVPVDQQTALLTVGTQPVLVPMTVLLSASTAGTKASQATITLHGNPGAGEPAALAGITDEINRVRAAVGVAPLRWNASLAATAQNWASSCTDQAAPSGLIDYNGSRSSGYPYTIGETLFGQSGSSGTPVQIQAVNAWSSEAAAYDAATGSCSGNCLHYTQVVWRSTLEVGCGVAVCPQLAYRHTVVCNWAPAGNSGGKAY
jgi:pathogenesis-related protein 1